MCLENATWSRCGGGGYHKGFEVGLGMKVAGDCLGFGDGARMVDCCAGSAIGEARSHPGLLLVGLGASRWPGLSIRVSLVVDGSQLRRCKSCDFGDDYPKILIVAKGSRMIFQDICAPAAVAICRFTCSRAHRAVSMVRVWKSLLAFVSLIICEIHSTR